MSFKIIHDELHQSIKKLDELYEQYNILDNTIFSKELEDINNKLNILYLILYNKLNISYNQLVVIDKVDDKTRTQFIKSKTDFINRLHIIRREIMLVKERIYPWPWNEIELCKEAYVIPIAKQKMEFREIEDAKQISIKELQRLTFKN